MRKYWKIFIMCGFIAAQVISVILSIILCDVGFDFGIYYRELHSFWSGTTEWAERCLYLNYFYVMFIWVYFLPILPALIIHIIITDILFIAIMIELDDRYKDGWFLGNLFFTFWFGLTFNVNIWIAFSFLYFQKYKEKWWAPFFLLIGFYKFSAILAFGVLYLLNLYYERKIRFNQFPAFAILLLIVAIGVWNILIKSMANATFEGGLLKSIQATHFIWWTVPLIEFTRHKKYTVKKLLIFWFTFAIATGIAMLIWFILSGGSAVAQRISAG
jgi:hypothetical protein